MQTLHTDTHTRRAQPPSQIQVTGGRSLADEPWVVEGPGGEEARPEGRLAALHTVGVASLHARRSPGDHRGGGKVQLTW